MFFPPSPLQERFSKQCLLVACFFAFSFNHIIWTKYHFVLGQASFYFIAMALLTSNFRLSRQSIIWITIFLSFCLGSALLMCTSGNALCTSRPYTAAVSLIFVFLIVQMTASVVETNPGFDQKLETCFIYAAWALVILALPDMINIYRGIPFASDPYGIKELNFLSLHQSNIWSNRLRGFTQEPSYLGMVIATLYPICLIRFNRRLTILGGILILGLWTCLIFSMSRTGILACLVMTGLVLLGWPKRLLMLISAGVALGLAWSSFPQLSAGKLLSFSWLPSTTTDGSTMVRIAHIFASINTWLANPLLGVGLGQAGFILPNFYPPWYGPGSPEFEVWSKAAAWGGTPSLSFLPRLLAEVGILGALLCIWPCLANAPKVVKALRSKKTCSYTFLMAFGGFMVASFGVDGYLYLPAWIALGAVFGLARDGVKA